MNKHIFPLDVEQALRTLYQSGLVNGDSLAVEDADEMFFIDVMLSDWFDGRRERYVGKETATEIIDAITAIAARNGGMSVHFELNVHISTDTTGWRKSFTEQDVVNALMNGEPWIAEEKK